MNDVMGTSLNFTGNLQTLSDRKAAAGHHVIAGLPNRVHECDQGWDELMAAYVPKSEAEILLALRAEERGES